MKIKTHLNTLKNGIEHYKNVCLKMSIPPYFIIGVGILILINILIIVLYANNTSKNNISKKVLELDSLIAQQKTENICPSKTLEYIKANNIAVQENPELLITVMENRQIQIATNKENEKLTQVASDVKNKEKIKFQKGILGDICITKSIKYQITNAEVVSLKDAISNQFDNYLIADVIIKNTSDDRYSFSPYNFTVIDHETQAKLEYKYLTLDTDKNLLTNCTILPKGTIHGIIAIKVVNSKNHYSIQYLNKIEDENIMIDCTKKNKKVQNITSSILNYTATNKVTDKIILNNIELSIDKITNVEPPSYEKQQGYTYVILDVSIKNNSLSPQYISRNLFSLLQTDGILKENALIPVSVMTDEYLESKDIEPNTTIKGKICFQMHNVQKAWIVFQPDMFNENIYSIISLE